MARILPYLRLLRAGTLFSPAADVVAGWCVLEAAWSANGLCAVAASVCLYGAGMVWNDVADRAEDAVQRPERPLPRGDVSLAAAMAFGFLLVAGGMWLSPCRGHHGLIAALVLAYDFLLKKVVPVGAVAMGTMRALNLLTAGAVPIATSLGDAGSALAPPGYRAPLLGAALCYAVYIVAVTILGVFEDTRGVRPRAIVAVQAAPPVAAFAGLLWVQGGLWPAPALAALPILWFARKNRLVATWDQAMIRRSMLFLLLGTMLYTALLCVANARWAEAAAIAACIPLARLVARRISLT